MISLKTTIIVGIIVVGAAASLFIQRASRARFQEREGLVRQQEARLAGLTSEHERLAKLVAGATNRAPTEDHAAELVKLRAEAEALRRRTNELSTRLGKDRDVRPVPPAPSTATPEVHPPEFYEQLHQMAGGKTKDARNLTRAFFLYADDHQEQFPSSFDQIASYLDKEKMTLSGTNRFDIVYQGSFDRLRGLPSGTVAVIRDQQIWAGPDGKMRRVYGMTDGSVQLVPSDDNFQSWEAEHVIAPPKAGQ